MWLDWCFFALCHIGRIIGDIITVVLSPFIFLYYSYTRNQFTKVKSFHSIFITGGSSGIGKAIAFEFLQETAKANKNKQKVNLILTGTNEYRLKRTVDELKNAIPSQLSSQVNIVSSILDVTNKDEMKKFIVKMDEEYKLDLIIANAGTSGPMLNNPHYFESSKPLLDINCQGVLNTILPIIPRFQGRKQGHIACVGSLAGYFPSCNAGTYAATKAYVRFLCHDLRPKLKLIGNIDVSFIAPGYVTSRMSKAATDGSVKTPSMLTSEQAAEIIVNGLKNNHSVISFPGKMATVAWILGSLHPILHTLVSDKLVKREKAARDIGFYHEFDPDDEFGGEC